MERRGPPFRNSSPSEMCSNRPSFPETCYKNDKLQVTDPLLRISAKLLVLKPKEKTKQKFSRSPINSLLLEPLEHVHVLSEAVYEVRCSWCPGPSLLTTVLLS